MKILVDERCVMHRSAFVFCLAFRRTMLLLLELGSSSGELSQQRWSHTALPQSSVVRSDKEVAWVKAVIYGSYI
jgi:hypothetical protein